MKKKKRTIGTTSFIDPFVEQVVFNEAMRRRLVEATGWHDIRGTQIGNLKSRLRNLCEFDLIDEVNEAIENFNIDQEVFSGK